MTIIDWLDSYGVAEPLKRVLRLWGHCSLIPFGIRDRVLRKFHHPDCCLPSRFDTTTRWGHCYGGDFSSWIDWMVYYYGGYESSNIDLLRCIARKIPYCTFMDIGANVGLFSISLAPVCTAIHAIEPWPPHLARLRDLLDRNQMHNVTCHQIALSDIESTMPWYQPTSANQGTGSLLPDHAHGISCGTVDVRRADTYFQLERLDLIKIDTEGVDLQVLAGMQNILRIHHPIVLFEMIDTTSIYNHLFPQCYKFHAFDGGHQILAFPDDKLIEAIR